MDYYFLLRHDGTGRVVDLPEDRWLETAYDLIGCDCIEIVQTVFRDVVLVIDDSGKLKEDWEDRINHDASALYFGSNFGDMIVGNAILAYRVGPDLVPVPHDLLMRIFKVIPDVLIS